MRTKQLFFANHSFSTVAFSALEVRSGSAVFMEIVGR